MEIKKNPKVNLENYRGTFMLVGMFVAVIVIYFAVSMSKANVKIQDLEGVNTGKIDDELVAVTRQDLTPPPPPPPPQISEEIEIVDNSVKIINSFDFNTDVDDNTTIDFGDVSFEDPNANSQDDEPIVWAENMPEFPGGEIALRTFIANNIKYPELAAESEIQGTVYVRFVVTKTGKVGEVQVTRGVDPLLDQEAVRVIKKLPDFKPGSQGGRPVNVWYSVPIVFQLSN